ncbi:MAG: hypothetical protein AAGG01_10890, partial [Planctomycetota bacterium]
GPFRFDGLPTALYELSVQEPGLVLEPVHSPQALAVEADRVTEAGSLVAIEGGWISARSTVGSREEVIPPGALQYRVQSHASWPVRIWDKTIAGESQKLGPLPPGVYRISRQITSLDRHTKVRCFRDVEVLAGEVTEVSLNAATRWADDMRPRCTGRIRLDHKLVLGAGVELSDGVGVVATAISDGDGRFVVPVPADGNYLLRGTHRATGGRWSRALQIDLAGGASRAVTLDLRSGWQSPTPSDCLWGGTVSAGDTDGDGAADLFIHDLERTLTSQAGGRCFIASGATGRMLVEAAGPRSQRGRRGVGAVGDVNGDGMDDFVTVLLVDGGGALSARSSLALHSGRTGFAMASGELLDVNGSPLARSVDFVTKVDVLEDLDGDGVRDVSLIRYPRGSRDGTNSVTTCAVSHFSGASLDLLARDSLKLPSSVRSIGWGGDVNADGLVDLVVVLDDQDGTACRVSCLGRSKQRPTVLEGIHGWRDPIVSNRTCEPVIVDDLDGDGLAEIAIAAKETLTRPKQTVLVRVVSSGTGLEVSRHSLSVEAYDGLLLRRIPDVDGDGQAEILLAGHQFSLLSGTPVSATIHSGADLSVLFSMRQTASPRAVYEKFGISACVVGDVDGDAHPDVAIGAWNRRGPGRGCVELFSGRDGSPIRAITRETLTGRPMDGR